MQARAPQARVSVQARSGLEADCKKTRKKQGLESNFINTGTLSQDAQAWRPKRTHLPCCQRQIVRSSKRGGATPGQGNPISWEACLQTALLLDFLVWFGASMLLEYITNRQTGLHPRAVRKHTLQGQRDASGTPVRQLLPTADGLPIGPGAQHRPPPAVPLSCTADWQSVVNHHCCGRVASHGTAPQLARSPAARRSGEPGCRW